MRLALTFILGLVAGGLLVNIVKPTVDPNMEAWAAQRAWRAESDLAQQAVLFGIEFALESKARTIPEFDAWCLQVSNKFPLVAKHYLVKRSL